MAAYSQRLIETRRKEFVVPAPWPVGACWAEVSKAFAAARQELVQMGLVEEMAEVSDDQIRVINGDDEIVVFYTVEKDEKSESGWRTV